MDTYRLASESDLTVAQDALRDAPLDGSVVMAIKAKSSKSANQRAYQWALYRAIAKSGFGSSDIAEDVDAENKYRFRDIFFNDDEYLGELFVLWVQNHPDDIKWFCTHHLHTEKLTTKSMSEYLESIIRFYSQHGVMLPVPEDRELLDYRV